MAPAEALGDVSPVSSTCTPPGHTSASSHAAKKPWSFPHDVVEVARLVAALVLERVAVHRVADPDARGGRCRCTARSSGGSASVIRVGAHPAHQHEAAGAALGVEPLAQRDHLFGGGARAELHADRVLDAASGTPRARRRADGCARRSTRRWAEQSYHWSVRLSTPRERLLVPEDERLVRRVEVDLVELGAPTSRSMPQASMNRSARSISAASAS